MRFTTKCKTQVGKTYDIGEFEFPPVCSDHKEEATCAKCLVVNAWTEQID